MQFKFNFYNKNILELNACRKLVSIQPISFVLHLTAFEFR